ncbi:MAG: peptidylprolyl isomerase, partial [Planctomycetota bacterium]
RGKREAEAKLEDTRREVDRLKKELAASRETSGASQSEARLSQDLLVKQAKTYEAKIAFYKNLLAQSGTKAPDDATIAPLATATNADGGRGVSTSSFDLDAPVATIDGDTLTRRDLVEFLYFSQGPSALDPFIDSVLAEREAKRLGIEVTDEDVRVRVLRNFNQLVKQYGGDAQLDSKLAQSGLTREMLIDMLRVNERRGVYLEKLCLLDRTSKEYKERLDLKVRQTYELGFGEKVHAKHFFIAIPEGTPEEEAKLAEKSAASVREQLVNGADWNKVAQAKSSSSRLQAHADAKDYSHAYFTQWPELDRLFFQTPDGEVSQPVRTKLGISIVQVEKRTPATATFEEKRPIIHDDLTKKQDVTEDDLRAVTARLRAKAKIEKKLELK